MTVVVTAATGTGRFSMVVKRCGAVYCCPTPTATAASSGPLAVKSCPCEVGGSDATGTAAAAGAIAIVGAPTATSTAASAKASTIGGVGPVVTTAAAFFAFPPRTPLATGPFRFFPPAPIPAAAARSCSGCGGLAIAATRNTAGCSSFFPKWNSLPQGSLILPSSCNSGTSLAFRGCRAAI